MDNSGTPGVPVVSFTYGYNAVGDLTSALETIAGQAGASTGYTHDLLGRVLTINQSGTGVAAKRVMYTYDEVGQLLSLDRFAGVATTAVVSTGYTYDIAGRLTQLTHATTAGTIADYQLTFDAASRIARIVSLDDTADYDYDDSNQLIGVTHTTQPNELYSLDANGNRIGAGTSIGGSNRLISDGQFTYAYDDEGNRIQRTEIATGLTTDYEWDHRNRLIRVTTTDVGGNVVASQVNTYDQFDHRIGTTVDADGAGSAAAKTERFVHDRPQVALVFDGAGQVTHRYLYGPQIDLVLADETPAGVVWPAADHLRTTRDAVDSNGTVVNHLRFNSFGVIIGQTDPSAQPRFAFTGREFDSVTGLYQYRTRFYDPAAGRFINEDRIGFSGGDANLYRYVGNNPVTRIDPSGQEGVASTVVDGILSGVGGAIGIAAGIVESIAGLAVFLKDAAEFSAKVSVAIVAYAGAQATGSERAREEAEFLYKDTLGPIVDFLDEFTDLCAKDQYKLLSSLPNAINKAVEAYTDKYFELLNAGKTLEAAIHLTKPIGAIIGAFFPPAGLLKGAKGLGAAGEGLSGAGKLAAEANAAKAAGRTGKGGQATAHAAQDVATSTGKAGEAAASPSRGRQGQGARRGTGRLGRQGR